MSNIFIVAAEREIPRSNVEKGTSRPIGMINTKRACSRKDFDPIRGRVNQQMISLLSAAGDYVRWEATGSTLSLAAKALLINLISLIPSSVGSIYGVLRNTRRKA
jgi:hypothetical protein